MNATRVGERGISQRVQVVAGKMSPLPLVQQQEKLTGVLLGLCLGLMAADIPVGAWHSPLSLQNVVCGVFFLASAALILKQGKVQSVFERFLPASAVYALFCLYLVIGWFFFGSNGLPYVEKLQLVVLLPVIPLTVFAAASFYADRKAIYFALWLFLLIDALFTIYMSNILVRAEGLSGNPNATAVGMAFGVVFSFFLFEKAKTRLEKAALGLGTAPMLLAISLTASRTGFLSLLLGVLFVVAWRRAGRRRLVFAVYVVAMLFLPLLVRDYQAVRFMGSFDAIGRVMERSVLFLNIEAAQNEGIVPVYKNVEAKPQKGQQNITRRISADKIAFRMFRSAPLFGQGLGQKKTYVKYYKKRYGDVENLRVFTTHNTYLSLLSETGLVGFFLYGGFLAGVGVLLHRMISARVVPPNLEYIWLAAGFVVFLAAGVTWLVYLKKVFWVFFAIVAAEYAEKSRRTLHEETEVPEAVTPARPQ